MYFTRKLKGRSSEKTSKFWVRRVGQSFELMAFVFSPISRASWSYISALVPIKKKFSPVCSSSCGRQTTAPGTSHLDSYSNSCCMIFHRVRPWVEPAELWWQESRQESSWGVQYLPGQTGSCLGSCSPLMIWSFLLKSRQWSGMELQQIIKPLVSY